MEYDSKASVEFMSFVSTGFVVFCAFSQQMQSRLDIRNSLSNKKDGICFRHVKETNYKKLLVDRNTCLPEYKFIEGGVQRHTSPQFFTAAAD